MAIFKTNKFGKYIPAGQLPCKKCKSHDDTTQVFIDLPKGSGLVLCWTCAEPYLKPLLSQFFDEEQLGREGDRARFSCPQDPRGERAQSKAELPANHPKMIQQRLEKESV